MKVRNGLIREWHGVKVLKWDRETKMDAAMTPSSPKILQSDWLSRKSQSCDYDVILGKPSGGFSRAAAAVEGTAAEAHTHLPYTHPPTFTPTHPYIHPPLPTHPYTHSPLHPPTHPSTHPPLHQPTPTPTHLQPPLYLPTPSPSHPYTHPPLHLATYTHPPTPTPTYPHPVH